MFTVGPLQENCFLVRRDGLATARCSSTPATRPSACWPRSTSSASSPRRSCSPTRTSTTSAPSRRSRAPPARRSTARARELPVLARPQRVRPARVRAVESWEAEETVDGGERLQLAGFDIDVSSRPATARPRHLRHRRRAVLRRRALRGLDRPHRPARRRPRRRSWPRSRGCSSASTTTRRSIPGHHSTAASAAARGLRRRRRGRRAQPRPRHLRDRGRCSPATCSSRTRSAAPTCRARPRDAHGLDRRPARALRRRHEGPPRPHGAHDARPRARDQPLPAGARGAVSEKPQAPRGTYDVLPEQAAARAGLEDAARRILEPRRLPAHRDADLRGHRAVRPRRGRVDRHRPEGDVHLRGRRRALADAAPRGHRAGRAAPTSSTACTSSPSR